MKRSIEGFSMFEGLTPTYVTESNDPEKVTSENDFDRIFKEIFAVDPLTGLPKGDIAYYLSKDGNPQVKEWLKNNLLSARAAKSGTSIEGVTDDMIAECQRKTGESGHDYAFRLQGIYESCKKEMQDYKSKIDSYGQS